MLCHCRPPFFFCVGGIPPPPPPPTHMNELSQYSLDKNVNMNNIMLKLDIHELNVIIDLVTSAITQGKIPRFVMLTEKYVI